MTSDGAPTSTRHNAPTSRRWLLGLGVGAGAAFLGLLPWLVSGARLSLQNLWAIEALPEQMPLSLLPLSQYQATVVLALLLMGGLVAGPVQRVLAERRGVPVLATISGLLLVQLVAVIQSFTVLARGLGLLDGAGDSRASVYLGGLLGGTVIAVVLAVLVVLLASRREPAWVALGVGAAAAPVTRWVDQWSMALSSPYGSPPWLSYVSLWLAPVLVGGVVGWALARSRRRGAAIAVGLVCLALLGLTSAALTAIDYGLGMRILGGDLAEMARAASDVFPLALRQRATPVLVAAGMAAAVWGLLKFVRRRG